MKFFPNLLIALGLTVFLVGCDRTPETLVKTGYDEAEMDAAMAHAREHVDVFLQELASPQGGDHAVKVAIDDGTEVEHFWITEVKFENEEFHGTINNEPGLVKNVSIGQKWSVDKSKISDWLFFKNDKMYGNFTMRPLLKNMPKKEADSYRAMLADQEIDFAQ